VGSIRLETLINAPIERCFDLARSIDAHIASTARTKERVVAGKAHGLLDLGESVTWEGRHFGIRIRQSATITRFDPPHVFIDESSGGPLKAMRHTHQFVKEHGGTLMVDTFEYELPVGGLGRIADRLVIERHMKRFLRERAAFLKAEAERSGGGG
jgi:ligand-binding SRPBCC domain-containing protein